MLDNFLQWLPANGGFDWDVAHHKRFPPKKAKYRAIPAILHDGVRERLAATGIKKLYSHQEEAIRPALQGKDVVLCTSTASGKTLAYQIPVLDCLLREPESRALLIFPLKALERDQLESFVKLAAGLGISAAVYDGDTPDPERKRIRSQQTRVIITNPDMLHLSMLAFHDSWRDLFANLRYIVLDEVHTYKGIFGSNISLVLMRALRICEMYGGKPQFFACSATIANPGALVANLTGREFTVVDKSGAALCERHFVFINPTLSIHTIAVKMFTRALKYGLKSIVFTRARRMTELIGTWTVQSEPKLKGRISSYRAGFLPQERRDIEAQLFAGALDGVVSTSALEMGIDVGGLDLCILVGYPGTIVSTWQRGGRVGRAGRPSAVVLIAGQDALDQYFVHNPEDFFKRNCEEAILDPQNPEVLKKHIPCAASETEIHPDEAWALEEPTASIIRDLEENELLYKAHDGCFHSTRRRPHRGVDLRGIGESYGIFLKGGTSLLGSTSGGRAFSECHEGAVYLHRGGQYIVKKLDLERRNAIVEPCKLDYYTRALNEKNTEIIGQPLRSREFEGFVVREGKLKVTERITGYEKIRSSGQELIGVVELDLPELQFETIGIWIEIPEEIKRVIEDSELHFMGGIHAMEHAAISMFPLFALCDRNDIGGISTPQHEQVCKACVFIYDGHPGGVGLSHRAFDLIIELMQKTLSLVEGCGCIEGCPSCIHSPKCGSGNKPLDKDACVLVLRLLLDSKVRQEYLRQNRTAIPAVTSDGVPRPAIEVTLRRPDKGPEQRSQLGSESEAVFMKPDPKFDSYLFPDLAEKSNAVSAANVTQGALVDADSVLKRRKSSVHAFLKAGRRETVKAVGYEATRATLVAKANDLPIKPEFSETARTSNLQPFKITECLPTRPEEKPGSRRIFFDLETQKLAQEVGGWRNVRKMGLSLAVVYIEGEGFRTFFEDDAADLIETLKSADTVIGFNHVQFDYEVLRAYTSEDLCNLNNLDILQYVTGVLGTRLALNHLAKFTLGRQKIGDGCEAVTWFRQGKMDLLEKYCREDVIITQELYNFGLRNKFLLYQKRDRNIARLPVNWI
jgi:DEAD/DEAH box helicase domain-containing protein